MNIGHVLTHAACAFPYHEAAVDPVYRFTSKQLNNRVNQLAHWLREQGVQKGDRVAYLLKNRIDSITIFFAAVKIGAIALPLNWRLHPEELVQILQDCSTQILFFESSFTKHVDHIRKSGLVQSFISTGQPHDGAFFFEEILTGRSTKEPEIPTSAEDPALIIYTSGTTGRPKGVVLSHQNLQYGALGMLTQLDWRVGDRTLVVTPVFHISGLITSIICMMRRCTAVFMPDFHPGLIWELVDQEKITQFMAIPTMLKLMAETRDFLQSSLDSLRYICCGATSVPSDLIQLYQSFGIEVYQVYGSTEIAGATSIWTSEMGKDKHHTVGKPVLYMQVKLVDPITRQELTPEEIAQGKVGEILVKGPQVFLGYWNNPEETKKALVDGWHYTGDLGRIDEDGFLSVVDRYKDMIIYGGTNIYPAEVEAILSNFEGIAEVAVVGAPDELYGEVPVVFIVKKPGAELKEEDIIQNCRGKLADFKCGKDVVFVEEFPKNSMGKVRKDVLKQWAIARRQNT